MNERELVGSLHATVSRNVRRLMLTCGYRTQRDLAEASRIDRHHLCRKLGGREAWRLVDVERLADALGVEPGDLLTREAP